MKDGSVQVLILNTKLGIENGILKIPENWEYLARLFICTGKNEYLKLADEFCEDLRINAILTSQELMSGSQLPAKKYMPLVEALKNESRKREADVIEILGLRRIAEFAVYPVDNKPDWDKFSFQACDLCAQISAKSGFQECEAFFARLLSIRYMAQRNRQLAITCIRNSVKIFKTKSKKYPEIFLPELAHSLSLEGVILINANAAAESESVLRECVSIREILLGWDKGKHEMGLAYAALNLGITLTALHKYLLAREMIEKSLRILVTNHEGRENINKVLSTAHLAMADCLKKGSLSEIPVIIGHYQKAIEYRSEKGEDETGSSVQEIMDEIAFLNSNFKIPNSLTFNKERGWDGIDWKLFESSKTYQRTVLEGTFEENDPEHLLKLISICRNWKVNEVFTVEFLKSVTCALSRIEKSVDKKIGILLFHSIGSRIYVGLLQSRPPYLSSNFISPSFRFLAEKVIQELNDSEYSGMEDFLYLNMASEFFPQAIIDEISTENFEEILICGDDFTTQYPWELLFSESLPEKWLGSKYSLARIQSINPSYIDSLEPIIIGHKGQKSGLVLCPWDTDPERLLFNAAEEADRIREKLVSYGLSVDLLLGTDCSFDAFLASLAKKPSIIHISGHGKYKYEEVTFILWSEAKSNLTLDLSRHHITKAKQWKADFFENSPLVLIDCCYNGVSIEHRGEKEDIVHSFLNSGASAVISSPLRILDKQNDLIYSFLLGNTCRIEIGESIVEMRKSILHSETSDGQKISHLSKVLYGNPFSIWQR